MLGPSYPPCFDHPNNINLFPPSVSLTKVQTGAYYSGMKLYNHIPKNLKQLCNDNKSFGPAIKRFLYIFIIFDGRVF
jgi:hypothetical protein